MMMCVCVVVCVFVFLCVVVCEWFYVFSMCVYGL